MDKTYAPSGLISSSYGNTSQYLSDNDSNMLLSNLMKNLQFIKTNKYNFSQESYNQLVNYHSYSINMINQIMISQKPTNNTVKDILVFEDSKSSQQPWANQFNENIYNPPMYSLPPNNVWAKQPFVYGGSN